MLNKDTCTENETGADGGPRLMIGICVKDLAFGMTDVV